MACKLSILICSLESRKELLNMLLNHLKSQQTNEVEILVNTDNKQKSTGKKRQELLEAAVGDYVIYIDDDDWVSPYYIQKLLQGISTGVDCLAINGTITTDGRNSIKWYLSKDNKNVTIKENGATVYLRTTNHITAVKRELALKAGFPDISNAEDKEYSQRLNPYLKTEFKILPPMYYYRFETRNKQYK